MMWRNDAVAAQFALDEFKRDTIAMVYLLNKVYCLYYKWMWRENVDMSLMVSFLYPDRPKICTKKSS